MFKYPWFRMHYEIIDDEKVGQLAFEDRWHFVALLCLKCKGLLDQYEGARLDECVGYKLGLGNTDRDRLRDRLVDAGLITEDWQPIGWDGRQYVKSDHDVSDRVRRSREKRFGNVTETCHSVSVLKQEEEKNLSEMGTSSLSSSSLPPSSRIPLIEEVKKEYPRGMHNSIRIETIHEIYNLDNIDTREIVLNKVKEYAAQVRALEIEGTTYVKSINTFFKNQEWKNEFPLPEKKQGKINNIDADKLLKVLRGDIDV